MAARTSIPMRVLGSAFAGAVGFAVGFYSGFFLLLSVLGFDAAGPAFVAIGGGLGVVGAALAIALSARPGRRRAAAVVTVSLGLVLLLVIHLSNGDFGALMLGGLLLVFLAALLVRTGASDSLVGGSVAES